MERNANLSSSAAADALIVILRLSAVMQMTGLSRTTIYELIADGRFPKQLKIGTRAVGWRRSELEQWANARIHSADARAALAAVMPVTPRGAQDRTPAILRQRASTARS